MGAIKNTIQIVTYSLASIGVVIAIGAIWLVLSVSESDSFVETHEAFIKMFTIELAKRWNPDDINQYLTDEFSKGMTSEQGRYALNNASILGRVTKVDPIRMIGSGTKNGVKQVTVEYDVRYQKGLTKVTMVIHRLKDGNPKVHGFSVHPKNSET